MTLYRDIEKLTIYLDLSTYCNAGCPQCNRTNWHAGGLNKNVWIPNVMWDLDRVKRAYPPESNIFKATICGTWGDPMMVKDIDKIIYYFLENDVEISLNTNGSLREPMWWYTLGRNMNEYDIFSKITFDIDGITNEMHSRYRRKTDLDKVLENMESYTLGGGIARAHCIVFEHNEDYLKEIRDLALEKGAREIDFQKSNRKFGHDGGMEFRFKDENGQQATLRRSTREITEILSG